MLICLVSDVYIHVLLVAVLYVCMLILKYFFWNQYVVDLEDSEGKMSQMYKSMEMKQVEVERYLLYNWLESLVSHNSYVGRMMQNIR